MHPYKDRTSPEHEHVGLIPDCDQQSVLSSYDSEEDDPWKAKEAKELVDYTKRFESLFKAGEYQAAAVHAAQSPKGALRNMDTMEMFKEVTVQGGGLPPLLLYFQALINFTLMGLPSAALSVEGVKCALQLGFVNLVTHWITQHRVTYSEALGDVIYNHTAGGARLVDTCLALAQIVYRACGVRRREALCLCHRGMINGGVECVRQSLDDCVYLLTTCPSLPLLNALTQVQPNQPCCLSVGFAVLSLLSTHSEQIAFQFLEDTNARGPPALERAILDDSMCMPEDWSKIVDCCRQQNQPRLAQDIVSVLLSQPGVVRLSPDSEGAGLIEHVFL